MRYISIFIESLRIAIHSLNNSKLRSSLSLLGISLGIFSIIAVKSAVDSFHDTIASGFSEFGSDVVYVDKMPWMIRSREEWIKYNKRPDVDFRFFDHLQENLKTAEYVSYSVFSGGQTIKYKSKNVSNAFIVGSTMDYIKINTLEFETGRYFTPFEYKEGSNVLILGATVASTLFEGLDPIGKKVKLFGKSYLVIGVLAKEGESMFNFMNFDEAIWVNFNNFKKAIKVRDNPNIGNSLAVRAQKGIDLSDVKDEIIGYMRPKRHLKPKDKNDFSINEIAMLNNMVDSLFKVVNIAGFLIGIFALIIGMFSVANIMFVSVKERTNIIGIKKALGAQSIVILSEFLFEAIILCIVGGMIGVFLVYLVLLAISHFSPIEMYMSFGNVMNGLIASIVVGIIAGILPAYKAANMDPVEAIRQ